MDNQSIQQSPPKNIPETNPTVSKPKIPVTVIIIVIFLILAVALVAFWVGKKSANNPIKIPRISQAPNHKFLQNPQYCEKDSDCGIETYCQGSCKCPQPKNKQNLKTSTCNTQTPRCLVRCAAIDKLICDNHQCSIKYKIDKLYNSTSPTLTTSFPDFSKEAVKPKTNIDISNWKTFDDPKVGLRFKYPPEWGTYSATFDESHNNVETYGGNLRLNDFEFGYNAFRVFGQSIKKYSYGMMGEDFSGLDEKGKFCSNLQSDESRLIGQLFCTQIDSTAHVLIGGNSRGGGGSNLIELFQRNMYLYKPNKKIAYFKLSGEFLSKKYAEFYDNSSGNSPPEGEYEKINQALLDRRLDSESMKNFDTIEKVFETVESY